MIYAQYESSSTCFFLFFSEKVRPDFTFLKVGVLKMAYSGDVIATNFTTLVTGD